MLNLSDKLIVIGVRISSLHGNETGAGKGGKQETLDGFMQPAMTTSSSTADVADPVSLLDLNAAVRKLSIPHWYIVCVFHKSLLKSKV